MSCIIAVLFEETIDDSYVAVMTEDTEPEVLFMKGPGFVKTMGPFPLAYAEATFRKWGYCRVENPPEVHLKDIQTISGAVRRIVKNGEASAVYVA
jgi:hypothetical protein